MISVWASCRASQQCPLGCVPNVQDYNFEAVGWESFSGDRYATPELAAQFPDTAFPTSAIPSDPTEPHGIWVHVTGTADDGSSVDTYFWAYGLGDFQDWAEWWVLIGALIEQEGSI
jgi:hypothetical protein